MQCLRHLTRISKNFPDTCFICGTHQSTSFHAQRSTQQRLYSQWLRKKVPTDLNRSIQKFTRHCFNSSHWFHTTTKHSGNKTKLSKLILYFDNLIPRESITAESTWTLQIFKNVITVFYCDKNSHIQQQCLFLKVVIQKLNLHRCPNQNIWQISSFLVSKRSQLDDNLNFLHLIVSDSRNLVLIPSPVLLTAEGKLRWYPSILYKAVQLPI